MTDHPPSRRADERPGRKRGRGRARRAGTLVAMLMLLAPPASASPDTFRVALEDTIFGVADVALSPVNGTLATHRNLAEVSGNPLLQALSAVPAFVGLTVIHVGQGALRALTGAASMLPGLVLFPFDTDLAPGFNLFRQGDLLVDLENPLAESPSWLIYVLPITPATIDARIGPMSPWALYADSSDGDTMEAVRR